MMRGLTYRSERGYTLMEVLIVATIVGILVTVGTVQYLEVKRRAKEHYCAQRLAQLAVYEHMYFKDFGSYGDWNDLRNQGYIDMDYIHEDDELLHYRRPYYIQEYELDFNIAEGEAGFEIVATPVVNQTHLWYPRWIPLGGINDLRSMKVQEDAVVKWLDSGRPVL